MSLTAHPFVSDVHEKFDIIFNFNKFEKGLKWMINLILREKCSILLHYYISSYYVFYLHIRHGRIFLLLCHTQFHKKVYMK